MKSFRNGKLQIDNQVEGKVKIDSQINGGIGVSTSQMIVGTKYHDKLENREIPNQHPIEAISGLNEALAEKANAADLAPVAFSGLLNDLTSDGFTILNCGTSTEVI